MGAVVQAIFVRAEGDGTPKGIGKLISLHGTTATVEYFDSPTDEPVLVNLPVASLEQLEVPAQTRVYWLDPDVGGWRVGRVIDGEGDRFSVRFPNRDERLLPVQELFIRFNRPISDPTPYLAHWVNETPRFADARSGFVSALVAQRAACQGMSGLLSSVVDLEPHQVEVVRRVLQDPIQRYLLADEVGLGKTIEAGILIRQYVLDDPENHKVVVLVPNTLVAQWEDELRRRFLLDPQEPDEPVCVVSMADHAAVAQAFEGTGMLVVDEAHHLSSDKALYELVRNMAAVVPRILLLSATPVLRNERGFLQMLHLLDPVVYSLNGEEAFRRKIAHRQMVAETVAGLVPENLLIMENFLDDLTSHFSDDQLFMDHVTALRAVVATFPADDNANFLEALSQVRGHLSEVYRLDRRILRNRRANVPGLTPDRAGVTFIDYRAPAAARFTEAFDAWRSDAALGVYEKEDSEQARRMAAWFAELLEAALSDHPALLARIRADGSPGAANLADLRASAEALADDESRMVALLDALTAACASVKCVIFCSTVDSADRVFLFLRARLKESMERSGCGPRGNGDDALRHFIEDPACRILVCDHSDEEGLNLQGGAKAIIHYDLPLEPNRIEQRIGRLDRYGAGASIQSFVLRCLDDPFEQAWTVCLSDGLGVFDRSIASLQYLLDDEMLRLRAVLLVESEEAITAMTARLGGPDGEVARELRRIDHQDALDALATPLEDSLDTLFKVDDDWNAFQDRVDRWLVECLMMDCVPGPDVGQLPLGDRVIRFRRSSRTLIPLDRFVDTMLPALDTAAPRASSRNPLTYPYTCRRQTALSRRCRRAGVRLLRYGDVLLNGLEAITSHDDRGRCFAEWRSVPNYQSINTADTFLRFDFVVEVNTTRAVEIVIGDVPETADTAKTALRRRGDMMYPPFFHRLWLDDAYQPVVDLVLLARLDAPYAPRLTADGRQDFNINYQRLGDLRNLELPIMDGWLEFVSLAKVAAEDLLCSRQGIAARGVEAVAQAKVSDAARFARLRMRIQHGDRKSATDDRRQLDLEEQVAASLYEGMLNPRISLDTIGVVFLSDQSFDGLVHRELATEMS